jgi:hypothetical protein
MIRRDGVPHAAKRRDAGRASRSYFGRRHGAEVDPDETITVVCRVKFEMEKDMFAAGMPGGGTLTVLDPEAGRPRAARLRRRCGLRSSLSWPHRASLMTAKAIPEAVHPF